MALPLNWHYTSCFLTFFFVSFDLIGFVLPAACLVQSWKICI